MGNYGYKGWIKLWREEMHNPMYREEPFTKWQAWIDLCMRADSNGTVKSSLEALKNQWLWGSRGKVARYLRTLSETGLVTVNGTQNKGTLIRINTGNSSTQDKTNGTRNGTKNGPKNGIEESTSKEVGMASLEVSHPTEYKKNIITEESDDVYGYE